MCTPAEFATIKDDLVRIERDLDAQIVVKAARLAGAASAK
jgi:ABC-type protease/lipase transport system fused ATPase/permease subunit